MSRPPRWGLVVVLVAAALLAAAAAPSARADGDPGSDVLVYQDLFAGSDAGLSVQQQVELGSLLKATARAGAPVRVAVIASRFDLGAVTGLWRNPRAYARFLGIELSLVYKQRLLVVMPNGFGFNWPGHSTAAAYRTVAGIPLRPGGDGLFRATEAAVRRLMLASGVNLPAGAAPMASSGAEPGAGGPAGTSADNALGIVALSLVGLVGIVLAVRRVVGRRVWRRPRFPGRLRARLSFKPRRLAIPGAVLLLVALAAVVVIVARSSGPAESQADLLAKNEYLDPGTPVSGAAPDFTLSDQFGAPASLHSFRGKVVILAFNDSECTTVCPLTTTAMLDAKAMLGKAARDVQLLGIDANPAATSLEDVWSYSELHGMLHAWRFLTGSLSQLEQVWKRYGIEAAIERGEITHTPALFVIDRRGRLSRLYVTQMSYTAVPQLGQLLAQSASALLPGRPAVHANASYAQVQPITPADHATLQRADGETIKLGPGASARLFLFFATWDQETSALAGQLDALNRYQALAARSGLPPLTAVDEASVEPSSGTLHAFLRRMPQPLSYPVAIDRSGRLADGYEVLGLPWFVVVSSTGRILYYREVSTAGWPSTSALVRYVKAALARAPRAATGAAARQELAGSPPALAALHQQAGQLLANEPALAARLRALRGYPVVINAWASWCGPCRSEFGLFAAASASYGRRVAFLGADTDDSAGDARTFLAGHPVGYPSYQTSTSNMTNIVPQGVVDLPTTVFISPAGKVAYVHTGQYDAQGTLDQDIESYALGH